LPEGYIHTYKHKLGIKQFATTKGQQATLKTKIQDKLPIAKCSTVLPQAEMEFSRPWAYLKVP